MAKPDEIMSALSGDADELERQRREQMASAIAMRARNNPYEQAIIGLGPVLLGGLLGGKKGAYSGAVGGSAGLKQYGDAANREYELGLRAALAEAEDLGQRRRDITQQFQDLQKGQIEHGYNMAEIGARQQQEGNAPLDPVNAEFLARNVESAFGDLASLPPEEAEQVRQLSDSIRSGALTKNQAFALQKNITEQRYLRGEGRRENVLAREIRSRDVPQTRIKTDESGKPYVPTDKEEKDANLVITTYNLFNDQIKAMRKAYKNGIAIDGAVSREQVQELGQLLMLQKERFRGGAAYTEMEALLAGMGLGVVDPKNPLVGTKQWATWEALGRNDPLKALDRLQQIIQRESYSKIGSKYELLETKTLSNGKTTKRVTFANGRPISEEILEGGKGGES